MYRLLSSSVLCSFSSKDLERLSYNILLLKATACRLRQTILPEFPFFWGVSAILKFGGVSYACAIKILFTSLEIKGYQHGDLAIKKIKAQTLLSFFKKKNNLWLDDRRMAMLSYWISLFCVNSTFLRVLFLIACMAFPAIGIWRRCRVVTRLVKSWWFIHITIIAVQRLWSTKNTSTNHGTCLCNELWAQQLDRGKGTLIQSANSQPSLCTANKPLPAQVPLK